MNIAPRLLAAPNYMIDIETTGLKPHRHAITSVACVQFDITTGALMNFVHFAVDRPEGSRECDELTMKWRMENKVAEMEREIPAYCHPKSALARLSGFIHPDGIVWAKPVKFDIAFLESYYEQFAAFNPPWHYRNVMDLGSYVTGRGLDIKPLETVCKEQGDYQLHDAYSDCLLQIAVLHRAHILSRHGAPVGENETQP